MTEYLIPVAYKRNKNNVTKQMQKEYHYFQNNIENIYLGESIDEQKF